MLVAFRFLFICMVLFAVAIINNDLKALAEENYTSLDKKLIKLRINFTELRIKSEKAKEDWLTSHDKLLSIEDLQVAYKNLIELSKSDLDILALIAIGIDRNLNIPQKTYQTQYNRYIIKEIITTELQQQLARQIKNSQLSLQNLVFHRKGALSSEQQSRLQYYRIEKISEQIKYRLKQKKIALLKFNRENESSRKKIQYDSANTVNLRLFLDTIDDSNSRNYYKSINWPKSLRTLTRNSDIQSPLKGTLLTKFRQIDKSGKKLSGIKISALGKDSVHAPFDGLVVFANKFRDLGYVVIITHKKRWYTILTGLNDIIISPGQLVLTNEPIGNMLGKGSILYQELRHGKKSVKPL